MVLNTKIIKKTMVIGAVLAYSLGGLKPVFASPQSLYDDVWQLINVKYVDSQKNSQDWYRWRHKYDSKMKTDTDGYLAIETMLLSLNDPYTKFLDPEEFADENSSINSTLFGIGIQIGVKDDKLLVIAPIEDTPAAKAGLKADDWIIEINGKNTHGISIKDAANQIRGEKGTPVVLKIKRPIDTKESTAKYEELTFTVLRDKIDIKSVYTKIPENVKLADNVGYIRLTTFLSRNAAMEFKKTLDSLKKKDGYILDLRSNPGGLLSNAIAISDMFLDGDVIVSTVDKDGYKDTQKSHHQIVTDKPVVILIDGGSASASEIFSGALKDNGRAVLVGTTTFGKGLVQEINNLSDGSGVNITTQKYLTPNGTYIHKKGISPDYEVKNTKESIAAKKDVQFEKAQEVLLDLISKKRQISKRETGY